MPETFTIHEVAGGVWAAVAPGLAGPAVSNAAIIDLGDKTLVVDSFMTRQAAAELDAEVHRLTGRAPYLVVNSHWHPDHVGGNQTFAASPIVGTARMRELIIEDSPKTPQEFEQRVVALQQSAAQLAADAASPEEREQAAGTQALATALAEQVNGYRLVLPDVLIEDRLTIAGERSATIATFGKGHTESDLFVELFDGDVLIAGDLVWSGVHPKASDGFPAEWAAILDRLAALEPAHVVPGHGPPGAAPDVSAMADYLRQLETLLAAVRAGELSPATAPPPPGSEEWGGLDRFHASLAKLAAKA